MALTSIRRLFVLIPVAAILFTGTSFSQEKPADQPATTDTQAKTDDNQQGQPLLEEIVVTAQKREETVQKVPEAVTAVSEQAINTITTGGADVKALSGRVPSLMIESSFGRAFPRFYIRGLGNTDFDLNASQPVSMVYDDVVMENPVIKGMPIWDLDRIEVLRGPQGSLFGRNTPAGVIKFESKKPSHDYEAYVQGSYGTYGTGDLKGAIGGGLTDTLAARFSFLYQTQDDWVDNVHTGKNNALGGYQNYAYRLQFLWQPVVRLSALLNIHGWDVDGTARIFRANIFNKGSNELVDGFDQSKVYHDGLNDQQITAHGGALKFDYGFDRGTLTAVTGYEKLDMFSRGDIDGGFGAVFAPPYGPGFIPFPSESSDGIPKLTQFTQEVRYASNLTGKWQYLVGAFYFDEDLKAETKDYFSPAPGNPMDGFATQQQNAKSWALFGSVDLLATERWKLKGGLRYTHDEKDFSAERPIPVFLNVATIAPVRANTDDNFTNWDLSALYAVSPEVNLYGRVATGSRAPSIQGRILFAPDMEGGTNPATDGLSVADTEDILSVEAGVKSELMNRSLRLNADIFHYTVDNQQFTAVGGQYNVATLLNADKGVGYGFETDINWAPDAHWLATIGLSYNHTEIQDATLAVGPCAACTITDPIGPNGPLVDGNSFPHAPEWIVNGIIDYRAPAAAGQFVGSFDWAYYSDKHFFLYDSKEFHADGLEFGLRFGYEWNQGKYGIAAYARNLADTVIVQNGIDFNNLTGMTNDPRNLGVEFTAKF